MKLNSRLPNTGSIGIFIVTLLTLTFLAACQGRFDKDDADRQAQAKKRPARVSVENGQTVLTVDTPTQDRLGLEVVTLTATLAVRRSHFLLSFFPFKTSQLFAMPMSRRRRSFKNQGSKQASLARNTHV